MLAAKAAGQLAAMEILGGLFAGTAAGRMLSGRNWVDAPVEQKVSPPLQETKESKSDADREVKVPAPISGVAVIGGRPPNRPITRPPSYQGEDGGYHPLNKLAEQSAFVRRMAGLDDGAVLLREAMADAGAASEQLFTPWSFVQFLSSRGVEHSRVEAAMRNVSRRFGDTANSKAIFRRWIVDKALPAAATAAVTYAANRGLALLSSDNGGIQEVYDDEEALDSEIDEAIANMDTSPYGYEPRNFHRVVSVKSRDFDGIPALDGSVIHTPSPGTPLGFLDTAIPKSSPTTTSSSYAPDSLPGLGIFSERMQGDTLSERAGMESARVRKSSIPIAHTPNSSDPRRAHALHDASIYQRILSPPTDNNLKRKAASTPTHNERGVEAQVTQNFDPQYVPALPSSVSGATSIDWRNYTGEGRGYQVPFTDTPNVVGIGYDAEAFSRQEANTKAIEPPTESPSIPISETPKFKASGTPQEHFERKNEVNAANTTNPAFRNVGRAAPEEQEPVYHKTRI